MKLQVDHSTSYQYAEPVLYSIQSLRLSPFDAQNYVINNWNIRCPGHTSEHHDGFDNRTHIVTLDKPHQEVVIHVSGSVEIEPLKPVTDPGKLHTDLYLRQTSLTSPNELLRDYSTRILGQSHNLDKLTALMNAILSDMPYIPGSTQVSDSAAQSFSKGAGVCQDHTHVFLSCCRHAGIPARYVSGYILSDDQTHVATHAWAEAWLDGAWYNFDITNQLTVLDQHLKLAIGLDYLDACPVRGVRFGGACEIMESKALVYESRTNKQ